MIRFVSILLVFFCLACDSNETWKGLSNPFTKAKGKPKINRPTTIDVCEYRGGQLVVAGSCGHEGEILLILPATPGDDRIIGSPRCFNGRYELITATFGRPPCEVLVEYGSHELRRKVAGADAYCP